MTALMVFQHMTIRLGGRQAFHCTAAAPRAFESRTQSWATACLLCGNLIKHDMVIPINVRASKSHNDINKYYVHTHILIDT